MRIPLVCAALLLAGCTAGFGQDFQRGELFAGYSYLRIQKPDSMSLNANGWNTSVTGNVKKWVGLTADISGHYGSSAYLSDMTDHRLSALFGPTFSYRKISRVTPFAHFLLGVTRQTVQGKIPIVCPATVPVCPVLAFTQTSSAFTFATGGGVDLRLTKHVWIRAVQADYVRPNFTNDTQNNVRISAGIVYRFGAR